ncbi:MAG: PadR family transcriptional regulator [Lachnospiraceae bacterium]|nr:PadR family transcriptional regulator [Lachnospiraceae bacterium]
MPMTETSFYILLCLQTEAHGYRIVQQVEELTDGAIRISPGTLYGSLSKMERDGLIRFIREEEKRKLYKITVLGQEVLNLEIKRIRRLCRNIKEYQLKDYEEKIEATMLLSHNEIRNKK